MDAILNKSIQISPLKKEIKVRGSCAKMMSVKVAMTDATELLGTLPLNQTSLLSGRAALLPGCPPQQSELRPGEDLLARRSRLLLQLWTSLKRAVTDMLQKQGCGIFRR